MTKNFKKLLIFSFVLLFAFSFTFAQSTIRGEIYDKDNNEPLIGANIVVKGEDGLGTVTDWDGSFEIKVNNLPATLTVTYIGYQSADFPVSDESERYKFKLSEDVATLDAVEVVGDRLTDKQKENPLTVESLDVLAIKETPSQSFYEGLGSLKGVDLTTASLGFTIINTRGFNSTSPVRSLQIIDGVDNQSPGLNFSLGNFLGAPELDVLKVELVVGAASAYFGPNAFNGVIDMRTRDPFYHRGLSASIKGGERNLLDAAIRYADVIKNKDGVDKFAYKFNLSYMRADDWEADNYDPTQQSLDDGYDETNPGGYDAINIYGDEDQNGRSYFDPLEKFDFPGLGRFYRRGYKETDLVDYNTRNLKGNVGLHYRINPEVELIGGFNLGSGTTVYQGDNRFSLKNILFYQGKLEIRKKDKFFLRAYTTHEDAGDTYDAYFTALQLQERTKSQSDWTVDYANYWTFNNAQTIRDIEGYPQPIPPFDFEQQEIILSQNQDLLVQLHAEAQAAANTQNPIRPSTDFLEPGTPEFEEVFNDIVSKLPTDSTGRGTKFYDKSQLQHAHGEYKFPIGFWDFTVGSNFRLYSPNSRGTIFVDTMDRKIQNWEVGVYGGVEKKFFGNKLKLNATIRMDKNQNFQPLVSPAISIVYSPNKNHIFRLGTSSAIRNPTLSDQYLNYNVGRAILKGNIDGFYDLVTIESLVDALQNKNQDTLVYFDAPPIKPEKVNSVEVGYRTSLGKMWIDASYYYSYYRDFIGYKLGADVVFDDFNNLDFLQVYRVSSNADEAVTTQGFSIGVNYYLPSNLSVSGNYSWNVLNEQGTDDPIIPAFNTPEHKFNIGFSGRDMTLRFGERALKHIGFNFNYKWIQGFLFEGSPQFTGFIPTYDLLDGQINIKVPSINTTFKVGASNILNNKQFQTYGGPRIGRLAYASIVYEWVKK